MRLLLAFAVGAACAWLLSRKPEPEPPTFAWRDAIEADYV